MPPKQEDAANSVTVRLAASKWKLETLCMKLVWYIGMHATTYMSYSRQLSLSVFYNDWVYSVCAAVYTSLRLAAFQSKSYRLGLHDFPGAMASMCLV